MVLELLDVPCVLSINKYYIEGIFLFCNFFFLFKPVKCYFNKEVIEVKEFNEGRDMTEKEDIGLHVSQSTGM